MDVVILVIKNNLIMSKKSFCSLSVYFNNQSSQNRVKELELSRVFFGLLYILDKYYKECPITNLKIGDNFKDLKGYDNVR